MVQILIICFINATEDPHQKLNQNQDKIKITAAH